MAAGPTSYSKLPPLRADPTQADRFDPERVAFARSFWHSQDDVRRAIDRQVEENCRMLAGQHWTVWNPWFQRFEDITEWLTEDERRWRQRPVVNLLLYWFMLTHSRLTESPPICNFLPATGDAMDAKLAEVSDTFHKTIWRDANMGEVIDELFSWMIPGGRAYLMSRVDMTKGELKPWVGPSSLALLDEFGNPTGIERQVGAVPFDAQGNPLARLVDGGESYEVTGQPHMEREGGISVDVLAPVQVRGEWGPAPWHRKRWHETKTFHSPDEVYDLFGVEVEPDTFADEFDSASELHRLMLGAGWFGATEQRANALLSGGTTGQRQGLVCVTSLWQAPCAFPGMEETEDSPGGRLLITTKTKVLRDGPRPARFRYTSPIRAFDFVRLPGRPVGSSPQEALNPLNRAINRGWAQFLEHRNLVANPIGTIDQTSGLEQADITNRPGQLHIVNKRVGVHALEYVPPPPLSADAWRTQDQLENVFRYLGSLHGAEGVAPTRNASGELVDQLRTNSDRWLGVTLRRAVEEFARVSEDWLALAPTIYTEERIITFAGEDSLAKTVQVLPEMFTQGKVHVVPDLESMLPEGRGERQARVERLYQNGAFGLPGSPEAIRRYMELSRFPHMNRAATPGGIDRRTAERENGRLLQGVPPDALPVYPWYDSQMHLAVHEEFMASPEYLELDPAIQDAFVLHRNAHLAHLAEQAALMAAAQPQPAPDAGTPGAAKESGASPAPAPAAA
jgi:hypothetical protein